MVLSASLRAVMISLPFSTRLFSSRPAA